MIDLNQVKQPLMNEPLYIDLLTKDVCKSEPGDRHTKDTAKLRATCDEVFMR